MGVYFYGWANGSGLTQRVGWYEQNVRDHKRDVSQMAIASIWTREVQAGDQSKAAYRDNLAFMGMTQAEYERAIKWELSPFGWAVAG